jgi:hypothetical protein
MKHAHKHLIAAALLALGFAATAQPAPAPAAPGAGPGGPPHEMMGHHGRTMDPAKMHERMQQHMAQRQAQLKQKLQITPAQEGAWTAYVAAMQPPANMQRPDRAEFAKLTTPERIDRMRALRTSHQAEMDKRGEATKTFYATLTAEQKKVFDAESWRGRRGDHHRGHHG